MRQIVPFEKNITFKTTIGEITAISLDNDLTFIKNDLISGNFYIEGSYKMLETETKEQEYSYKVPCEIAISDDYDTENAEIDIDDFSYEIKEDSLIVNIVVAIDNLERKQIELLEQELEIEDLPVENVRKESFFETKEKVKNQEDNYLTYKVYIYKETDTISSVLEKYSISSEDLENYNDIDNIKPGSKLVIPSTND